MIYPGENEPYVFAHRGYSDIAPENTLTAFEEAVNRGIPGVELDIHLCKSGELVVTHDDNLVRVTGFDGIVEELDYSEIKNLDCGKWKDPKFTGERIPLLQDVFDLLGSKVYYDIEIKSRKTVETGIEKKLFKLVREKGLEDRIIASSFNPMPLKYLKKTAPHIPTAIIYCSSGELPWYLHHGEGKWLAPIDILKPEHIKVNSTSVFFNKLFKKRPILPWTVNDSAEAARLIKAGANGVISNKPGELNILKP